MAGLSQRNKRRIELQPAKVRLRLVQLGAALVSGPEVAASSHHAPPGGTTPSFPSSATLRDTFSRANESPLSNGGKWSAVTGAADVGEATGVNLSVALARGAYAWRAKTTGISGARWNVAEQTNPAVALTINWARPSPAGATMGIWACLAAAAKSGYLLRVEVTRTPAEEEMVEDPPPARISTVILEKWVAGVKTVLATWTQQFLVGDRLGITVRGGVVRAWRSVGEEAFAAIGSVNDATYSTGYTGMHSSATTEMYGRNFTVGETTATEAAEAYTPPTGVTKTVKLQYLPPWLEPGLAVTLGSPRHNNTETVIVQSIEPATNTVVTSPWAQPHYPADGEYMTPADFPRQTILGRIFWASRLGINGSSPQGRGYSEGRYGRTLKNEGTFSVTLPNSVGSDGMLHRERFQLLSKQDYRPGDEWVEIWRSGTDNAAGDLLLVGTPVDYTINESTITISGFDAMWTLRKQREGTAGWFVGAPRDVFEEFTKVFAAALGSGFDDTSIFAPYTEGTQLTTADGNWYVRGAAASPVPSNVRIHSPATTIVVGILSATQVSVGTRSVNAYNRWRAEATCSIPVLRPGEVGLLLTSDKTVGATDSNTFAAIIVNGEQSQNVKILIEGRLVEVSTYQQATPTGTTGITSGTHSFAIEGRGRWLYFSIDGVMVFSYSMPETATPVAPQISYYSGGSSGPSLYVDVDFILMRVMEPYLMRSGDLGDYRLPGAPAPGGLQGVYFNDADLAAQVSRHSIDDTSLRVLNPATRGGLVSSTGSTSTAVFAERLDPAVSFSVLNGAGWEPPGLPSSRTFSVRWTGSVYLDLANYDFSFLVEHVEGVEIGVRLWVGKTRMGEQIVDDWQPFRLGPTTLPLSNAGSMRAHLQGNVSGWYPIVLEAKFSEELSVFNDISLNYVRSDHPLLGVPVNTGPYPHVVMADSPYNYFPLFIYRAASFFFSVVSNGIANNEGKQEYFVGSNETVTAVPGPIANTTTLHLAPKAGSPKVVGGEYPGNGDEAEFNTAFASGAGYTVEAWINPASATGTSNQVIFEKRFVWSLALSTTGQVMFTGGTGTAWATTLFSAVTVPSGVWTHVAATYDNAEWRIYINGVISTTSAPAVGVYSPANVSQIAGLGYAPAGTTDQLVFTGGIAHLAFYKGALSASRLLRHIEEGTASVSFANGLTAVSEVPASPQGVFEQQVRNDSHSAQLTEFGENFALQFCCEPQALESGNFPGLLCPRVREGKDTDYVLDHHNTIAPTLQGQAEDVADTEVLDAQGLADPSNSSQLYAEVFNFAEVLANAHAFVSTEYDSPGDIQTNQQLIQRASSLLALRSSPWTVISGSGGGKRELTDTYPVSGNWSEFAWLPGDGIRYELPLLGLEDKTPRQIYDVQWDFVPDGIAAPTISVLQRPKTVIDTVRKIARASLLQSRNYQGQLVVVNGTHGGAAMSAKAVSNIAGAADSYTRINLPTSLADVKSLTLVVQVLTLSGAALWEVEVLSEGAGVFGACTKLVIERPGRYDLTPWLRGNAAQPSVERRVYARLISNLATGSASYEAALEALVRV